MTTTDVGTERGYETILVENKGPICSITLNRPQMWNAAIDQMSRELDDAFVGFAAAESLMVAIHSGAGRAF